MLVIVWEFRVKAGQEAEFGRRYGPEGDWVGFAGYAVNVPLTAKPYRQMLEEARRLHEVFARATESTGVKDGP